MGGTKISKEHTKGNETIYNVQKMTIGQAPVLPMSPRFEGVICVGRNQFLDHAPHFVGCPVFRVPRNAGFDCNPIGELIQIDWMLAIALPQSNDSLR